MLRIEVVTGSMHGKVLDLDKECALGRESGSGATFIIDDPSLSRNHCSFITRSGGWAVRDSGSKNGTFVNGVRVSESPLSSGDLVQAGTTMMRIMVVPAPVVSRRENIPWRTMAYLFAAIAIFGIGGSVLANRSAKGNQHASTDYAIDGVSLVGDWQTSLRGADPRLNNLARASFGSDGTFTMDEPLYFSKEYTEYHHYEGKYKTEGENIMMWYSPTAEMPNIRQSRQDYKARVLDNELQIDLPMRTEFYRRIGDPSPSP